MILIEGADHLAPHLRARLRMFLRVGAGGPLLSQSLGAPCRFRSGFTFLHRREIKSM